MKHMQDALVALEAETEPSERSGSLGLRAGVMGAMEPAEWTLVSWEEQEDCWIAPQWMETTVHARLGLAEPVEQHPQMDLMD